MDELAKEEIMKQKNHSINVLFVAVNFRKKMLKNY